MKSKKFLQLITFVFAFLVFASFSQASPVEESEAISWANQTGFKLIAALSNPNLAEKYQVLDKMFEEDVDTPYVAKFVLGKYWKDLTPSQKKVYLQLFKRYVLSLYKSYPLDFKTDGLNFTMTSARKTGNFTDVFCRINLPEEMASENLQSINLQFKLSQTSGKIKIIDLKIGESSLLLTYRNRFNAMVKDADEDLEWFLEDFEVLTISNEKNVLSTTTDAF